MCIHLYTCLSLNIRNNVFDISHVVSITMTQKQTFLIKTRMKICTSKYIFKVSITSRDFVQGYLYLLENIKGSVSYHVLVKYIDGIATSNTIVTHLKSFVRFFVVKSRI